MLKKLTFFLITLLILLFSSCFASNWLEIFDKKYVDFDSVTKKYDVVSFWTKNLRDDPKDKFMNKDYWFNLAHWRIDCNNKKSYIDELIFYDSKKNIIGAPYKAGYPDWSAIIPDSYVEGYYRMFCLIPLEENPLLNY